VTHSLASILFASCVTVGVIESNVAASRSYDFESDGQTSDSTRSSSSAATSLERLKIAFASVPPHEVRFRVAGRFEGFTSEMIEQMRSIPDVEFIRDPIVAKELLVGMRATMTFGGDESVRVDYVHLLQGGQEHRRTHASLWNPTHTMDVASLNSRRCDIRPLGSDTRETLRNAFESEMYSYAYQRGETGYVPVVRYVQFALGLADDVEAAPAGEGATTVFSASLGVSATIDDDTGELRSMTLRHKSGRARTTEFRGWLQGSWFPARHPAERRDHVVAPDNLQIDYGDVIHYDSIRVIPQPNDSVFSWTSVAHQAKNLVTGETIDRGGGAIEVASSRPGDDLPVINPDKTLSPAPSTVSKPGSWAWIIGSAAGVGALLLWYRQRLRS
jgi:hypothetical protein